VQEELLPPDTLEGVKEKEKEPWRTEYDVVSTLRALGHEVLPVGVGSELGAIQKAIETHKPHVTFNLLEAFDDYSLFVPHVASYLELRKQKYTGCNPAGLTLSYDKSSDKKDSDLPSHPRAALRHLPAPAQVRRPNRLKFPLFVKSVSDEGSFGISQASLVRDDESCESA
jgi:D-alanine-D-alanine ligase